jgi:hypothetical protein
VKRDKKRPQGLDAAVSSAKDLFPRRSSEELAEIVRDTLVDEEDPASSHRLVFQHPSLLIELHVSSLPAGADLEGKLLPGAAAGIELEFETGEIHGSSIAPQGEFSFTSVPHRTIRLNVGRPDGLPRIRTDWFRV